MAWCRLYGEMVDDAKLKLLAFEDRWHYVALLCLKTQGVLDGARPELLDRSVCAKLGLGAREADEVRRRLIEVDLIDQQWQPLGWDRRQFRSDNSTARVQAWRLKNPPPIPPPLKIQIQIQIQSGNVTSNVSETFQKRYIPMSRYRRTRGMNGCNTEGPSDLPALLPH